MSNCDLLHTPNIAVPWHHNFGPPLLEVLKRGAQLDGLIGQLDALTHRCVQMPSCKASSGIYIFSELLCAERGA